MYNLSSEAIIPARQLGLCSADWARNAFPYIECIEQEL